MPEEWKPLVRVFLFPIRALIKAQRNQEAMDLYARLEEVHAFYGTDLKALRDDGDDDLTALITSLSTESIDTIAEIYTDSTACLIADARLSDVHDNQAFWNGLIVAFASRGHFEAAGEVEALFAAREWDMAGETLLELARALKVRGKVGEARVVVGLIAEMEGVDELVVRGVKELAL
jgi:hypothetical protein